MKSVLAVSENGSIFKFHPSHKPVSGSMEDDDQVPAAAGWISKSAMATAAIEHDLFKRTAEEDVPQLLHQDR